MRQYAKLFRGGYRRRAFEDYIRDEFYLRSPEPGPVGVNVDPLGEALGARVFPEGFPTLGVGPEGRDFEPTD